MWHFGHANDIFIRMYTIIYKSTKPNSIANGSHFVILRARLIFFVAPLLILIDTSLMNHIQSWCFYPPGKRNFTKPLDYYIHRPNNVQCMGVRCSHQKEV